MEATLPNNTSVNQQLDDEEEDDFTIDDFTDTDEEEEEKEAGGVSTYPKNMQVSNLNQKKSPKDALDPALDNSRVRKEWSTDEEEIFLKGLEQHKLDFAAIQALLPHRSRSQIRTHYRYIARSIRANATSAACGGKPIRRLRTRGRPPRSKTSATPSPLFSRLKKVIEGLEVNCPSKRRGRPSKVNIGSVLNFNQKDNIPVPTIVNPGQTQMRTGIGAPQGRIIMPIYTPTVVSYDLRIDTSILFPPKISINKPLLNSVLASK